MLSICPMLEIKLISFVIILYCFCFSLVYFVIQNILKLYIYIYIYIHVANDFYCFSPSLVLVCLFHSFLFST